MKDKTQHLLDSMAIETIYGHIERQKLKLIALTSPQPKSGNSLIALALAKRAAIASKKVLLIELNLHHPSQLQYCSTQPAKRLAQGWPAGMQLWSDALYDTDQAGLQLLIAPLDNLPHTELKSQELLSQYFTRLTEQYDLILCDTAPLLQPTAGNIPAQMICSLCQGTLLNVLSNVTTESQVSECSEVLMCCGARLSGAIMNDYYAPSLQQELIRETYRLEKRLPKLMGWLRRKIHQSTLINQSL